MIRLMLMTAVVVWGTSVSCAEHSQELARAIMPLIEAHEGDVAVMIKHLPTGATFEHNANQPMPTASLIKLPVLIKLYEAVEQGQLNLDDMIELQEADKVPGSGILTSHFSPGTQLSLRDAARLMMVYSDNTGTNLVVDRIGLPATAEMMERVGCPNTKLHSKVFKRETSIFPERSKQFGLGSTTAAEMVSLLERLDAGELVSRQACGDMIAILQACDDRTKIPRDLPADIKVAHKTGSVSNSRADAGLVDGPNGRFAICVLTTNNADRSWSDDNASNVLCGRIARAAFDHFNPDHGKKDETGPRELAMGADGELVEALQRTLNARLEPSPEIGVDGDFGPQTEATVKAFQRSRGLPETGRVDTATWAALGTLVEEEPVADPEVINSQQIEKQPLFPLDGPPIVTCKAWAIADGATGRLLWGDNEDQPLDPASTTKIMTGYIVTQLAAADPAVWDEIVTFSGNADGTIGSTSDLDAGEHVPVRELLYGLLLPSGNDASVAFAEHFGGRAMGTESTPNEEGNYAAFVESMNEMARRLELAEMHFTNTHGLTDETHKTSARDLAKLAQRAMSDPEFRRRTSTVQRGCQVTSESGYRRNVLWKNTNRLLDIEGFDGVKTGTTSAAGACLVSRGERDGRALIVVVLGSDSSETRYTESKNLYRWGWRQLLDQAK